MMRSRKVVAFIAGIVAVGLIGFVGGYQVAAQGARVSEATATAIGKQLAAQMSYKSPFETDAPDHLWALGDEGSITFIHFDKGYAEATRLIYIGHGVKGRWCAEDQQAIEKVAGKGYTHFHRTAKVAAWDAGHGGAKAGEPGYWLKHMAVGPGFKMPWGDVKPGVTDTGFMPTAAPRCGS